MLKDIIIKRIKEEGPISFHDFMEMALYYPALGYYNTTINKISRKGDFITMPELTSLFGQLVARQIEQMWDLLDKPPFTIIEYGAGTGRLCIDILSYLQQNELLYRQLQYCIIEKSEYMRDIEKKHCNEKVQWYNSIKEVSPGYGCIIANEVLDNFAVHRVIMKDELCEVYVDHHQGIFREVLLSCSDGLKNYLSALELPLAAEQQTEINIAATEWIQEVSGCLHKGFVMIIDYGYVSANLISPDQHNGSLRCYTNHTVSNNVYENPGERDITAEINFSAVKYWGERSGWQSCGLTLQSHFLHSMGLVSLLKNYSGGFYPLVLDMSKKFKLLVMQKGLHKPLLTGMQFATHAF